MGRKMRDSKFRSTSDLLPPSHKESLPSRADGTSSRVSYAHPSGGVQFSPEEVAEQRKAIWEFVKSIGMGFFEGKDLVSVSLPVSLFEPRSYLQRLTDSFRFIDYLDKAAAANNPVQRLLYVVAFLVSGLHLTCVPRKPFNPLLGETFQAAFENGTQVYCEQISHHPPISHWLIENGRFKLKGSGEWTASTHTNSVRGRQKGMVTVEFGPGDAIHWEMPEMVMKGVIFGERTMEYVGALSFSYPRHRLSCTLTINPFQKGFFKSFFSPSTPSDTLQGSVHLNIRPGEGQLLGILEGSWLGVLDWIPAGAASKVLCVSPPPEQRLWSIHSAQPSNLEPIPDPLPSDSRFRRDLETLARGDLDEAQRMKEMVEGKQRKEAALRKAA